MMMMMMIVMITMFDISGQVQASVRAVRTAGKGTGDCPWPGKIFLLT